MLNYLNRIIKLRFKWIWKSVDNNYRVADHSAALGEAGFEVANLMMVVIKVNQNYIIKLELGYLNKNSRPK